MNLGPANWVTSYATAEILSDGELEVAERINFC